MSLGRLGEAGRETKRISHAHAHALQAALCRPSVVSGSVFIYRCTYPNRVTPRKSAAKFDVTVGRDARECM
jgi:hypothetical protein